MPNNETISMSDVLELDMFNNTDSVYVQTSQGQEINFSALDIKTSPPGKYDQHDIFFYVFRVPSELGYSNPE